MFFSGNLTNVNKSNSLKTCFLIFVTNFILVHVFENIETYICKTYLWVIPSSHKLDVSLLKDLSSPYNRYALLPGIQRWVSSTGVYKYDFSSDKKYLILFENRKHQRLIKIKKK